MQSSSWRIGLAGLLLAIVIGGATFGVSQYLFQESKLKGAELALKRADERERQASGDHGEHANPRRDTLQNLLDVIESQLKVKPTDSMLIVSAANLCYDLENFEKAESYYKLFLEKIDSKNAAARIDLAYVVYRLGRSDEAIAMLKTVLKLDPANQPAYVNLAFIQVQLGKREEALTTMKKCLEVDPDTQHGKMAAQFLEQAEKEYQ